MTFGPPGGGDGGMGGGPPGGNMAMMMAPGGGDGGMRFGGRGGRGGGDQGDGGGRGGGGGPEAGAPGMGGGPGAENGGGDFGGGRGNWRGGRGGGGGEENGNDPTAWLESAFNEADENKSGALEKEEWNNLRRTNGEDLDKDKNGIISKQEYYEGVGERMGIKVDPSKWAYKPTGPMTYRSKDNKEKYPGLPPWFYVEDKDGDGQVTMAEHSSNWNDARIAEWQKLDTNGDGVMSRQEAIASTKPAPTGIVMAAPRNSTELQGKPANESNNSQAMADGGNNRGSRNNENNQPAIDPEQAREMKANRDKTWNRVGSAPAGGGAAPSYDLPADLPDTIDKAKATKSAKFFAQEDKDKDGFLSGKELEGNEDADTNKDKKADLKEYILYKAS